MIYFLLGMCLISGMIIGYCLRGCFTCSGTLYVNKIEPVTELFLSINDTESIKEGDEVVLKARIIDRK